MAGRTLSHYSTFLAEHLDNAYVYRLVYNSFMSFFERNIAAYDYKQQPVSFVGSTSVVFEDVLRRAAADFGISINKIIRYSMPGLVEFHSTEE